jgi:hypothetical protein
MRRNYEQRRQDKKTPTSILPPIGLLVTDDTMDAAPEIAELDGCIERLAKAMDNDGVDYITMSRETSGDVVITVRQNGRLIKVGWASREHATVAWTETPK